MIRKKEERTGPIIIDITGPQGNAFALMGTARMLGEQLGWDRPKITMMINDMTSGDYEHLLKVFDCHFGKIVILER
jgi:hypothetical protein